MPETVGVTRYRTITPTYTGAHIWENTTFEKTDENIKIFCGRPPFQVGIVSHDKWADMKVGRVRLTYRGEDVTEHLLVCPSGK